MLMSIFISITQDIVGLFYYETIIVSFKLFILKVWQK